MGIFIFVLIVMVVLFVFLGGSGAILYLLGKIFGAQNVSYKNSVKIVLFGCLIYLALGIALALVFLSLGVNVTFGKFVEFIVGFLVFHFFVKKYWGLNWGKSFGIYIILMIVCAILFLGVVIPIRLFIEAPFMVSGDAMSPSYPSGEYLLINEFNRDFSRGDVIVFRQPGDPSQFLLKRIIGLPGEVVIVQNNKVMINGKLLDEPYLMDGTSGNVSLTLGQDTYFVMGDNRRTSYDSRNFGPIQKSAILGKILLDVARF